MAALLWLFVPVLFPHHLLKNVLSSGAANPSLISASFPSGNPHQDYSQERPYPGECLHYFLSFAYLPSGTQLPKMNPTTMEINFELNFLLREFSLEWFQENTSKICHLKGFPEAFWRTEVHWCHVPVQTSSWETSKKVTSHIWNVWSRNWGIQFHYFSFQNLPILRNIFGFVVGWQILQH